MYKLLVLIGIISISASPCLAQSQPPIEAYGELPEIRLAALSDSGTKIAMLLESDGAPRVAIYDLEGGAPQAVGTGEAQVRGLDFARDDTVILKASETTRTRGYSGRFEYSGASSLDLETMDVQLLLKGATRGLWPAQSGLGKIIGHSTSSRHIYMPGWWANNEFSDPEYHVFRVDLETGRGRILLRGRTDTIDWIVSSAGEMIAREDYSNSKNQYQVFAKVDGKTKLIYEQSDVARPPLSLMGVMPDKSALVISTDRDLGYFHL